MPESYDVFLSYHSVDREAALYLVERLKERSVRVWVDVGELKPGSAGYRARIERAVSATASAIIAIGPAGTGTWQDMEIDLCLQETRRREFPLIPLLLPGGQLDAIPKTLSGHFTLSDFSGGFENKRAFDLLQWGITGDAVEPLIVQSGVVEPSPGERGGQSLDTFAMANVKAYVYKAAEEIASLSASVIAGADEDGGSDLTRWVVLLTSLRWQRGYLAAFERLFRVRSSGRALRDFHPALMSQDNPDLDGILGTSYDASGVLQLTLDGTPVASICTISDADRHLVERGADAYGRLGKPLAGVQSLLERLGDVPIQTVEHEDNGLATLFYQNRVVLAALVARYGMPGQDHFLKKAESTGQKTSVDTAPSSLGSFERVFLSARRAATPESPDDEAQYREYVKMIEQNPELRKAIHQIFGDAPDAIRQSWKFRR